MLPRTIVLLHGLAEPEITALRAACAANAELGLENVEGPSLDLKVGALLETVARGEHLPGTGFQPADDPVALLAFFPRQEMGLFIDTCKRAVGRPLVFGSVTPTNLTWTFAALVKELRSEHAEFRSRTRRADN